MNSLVNDDMKCLIFKHQHHILILALKISTIYHVHSSSYIAFRSLELIKALEPPQKSN